MSEKTDTNNLGFWSQDRTFLALAPMEEVTDTVFRELVLTQSDPKNLHILFTEFVATDGLCHVQGRDRVIHRLYVSDEERELLNRTGVKLVAQIWGTKPELFARIAAEIEAMGEFDGIDINMGCPVSKIIKKGACSGLIRTPELAQEIIRATQQATSLPVSVKTRIGFNKVITEEWIGALLETAPAAITIHGRIQKMQSEGDADWNEVHKAVLLRDKTGLPTKILGNGDVLSVAQSHEYAEKYGVDGVMIGRGIFHNPWLFHTDPYSRPVRERLDLLWFHTERFLEYWGDRKPFPVLRRFYKIYAADFHNAAKLRSLLMEAPDPEHVRKLLDETLAVMAEHE